MAGEQEIMFDGPQGQSGTYHELSNLIAIDNQLRRYDATPQ